MSSSTGDRIVLFALAVIVLAMAGIVGFEVWSRRGPPQTQATTTSAPAEAKPEAKPRQPKPYDKPAAAPSWERFNG